MVQVGYGSNDNKFRVLEKKDCMVYHSDCKHLHQRLLSAIHQFSTLDDKESVIVSFFFLVHTSKKKGMIETVLALTRISCSLVT